MTESVVVPLPSNLSYKDRKAHLTRYTYDGYYIAGVLEIWERRQRSGKVKVSKFLVQELKPDYGRRFELIKPQDPYRVTGEDVCYHVHMVQHNLNRSMCTCKGFEGHGKCKHLEALLALYREGRLPPLTRVILPAPTPPKRSTMRTPSNPGKKRSEAKKR